MKNIFNLSSRSKGTVNNGVVKVQELHSYDFVASPGFGNSKFDDLNDILDKIQKELNRHHLLETRRKKIEHLNKLSE